jgi:hypothetical protein
MNTHCHPVEQLQRQQFLDELYIADGRDDPNHPDTGKYTGLMQQHNERQKGEQLRQAFTEWWVDSYGSPPGSHAVMTHVAFAQHVLETMK